VVKTTISLTVLVSPFVCALALMGTKNIGMIKKMICRSAFIPTNLLILGLVLSTSVLSGQKTAITFDYLTVDEAPKGPIGFLGTAVSMYHPKLPVYAGIRLNNALIGDRAGYYTFGYQIGTLLPVNKSLSIHPKLMFTSGGGAESNDGSGGFGTLALTMDYAAASWDIGIGAQYSYVSTGVIQGASAYFSLQTSLDFSREDLRSQKTQLFTNAAWSSWNEHGRPTGFIGIGGRLFDDYTFKSVYLTAAVTDLGGYMDVYGGYGVYQEYGKLRLLFEANAGTGGGGRAPAGGGALYGVQSEMQYQFTDAFIGVSLGALKSLNAPFYFQYSGIRLGTSFSFNAQGYTSEGFKLEHLNFENSIRTYLGESGFSNLGIAFQLYKKGAISLRGESYWAFTDGRGAYAEGLFGVRYQPGWIYFESQLGAGAGGGINLWNGAGLAFLNTGLDLPISSYTSLNIKYVYNLYSTTPFPRHGVQYGFGFKIPFTKA